MVFCYREILFIIFDTDEIKIEFGISREFVEYRVRINESTRYGVTEHRPSETIEINTRARKREGRREYFLLRNCVEIAWNAEILFWVFYACFFLLKFNFYDILNLGYEDAWVR